MADDKSRSGPAAGRESEPAKPPRPPGHGNSLADASAEAVRVLEQGDEPAHAGRGDAG
ncbi:MAG TPA: hypothetical protein VGB54_03920 [Allosphingosinicella sp.]|jgi:hypothetical protein